MKKLLAAFLLWSAFLLPIPADAAARFAVCTTTCTWDNSSTAMWSATSGGATGASAPVAGDDVTLDAATCVGGTTCTITTFAGTISINSLVMSACTATTAGCILDASANNTNFTIAASGNAYINTGSGTRTLNMGSGTWTLSGNIAVWNIASSATLNAGTSTLTFTGTGGTGRKTFNGGTKTYSTVSFVSSTSATEITNAATIGTLTIAAGNVILLPGSLTLTVTTFTNISGSSSAQTLFISNSISNGIATTSSANNWSCSWCGFGYTTWSGGGTFTATNSADYKANTGISITAPSVGGGGVPRFIGG